MRVPRGSDKVARRDVKQPFFRMVIGFGALVSASCQPMANDTSAPLVHFNSAPQIGRWAPDGEGAAGFGVGGPGGLAGQGAGPTQPEHGGGPGQAGAGISNGGASGMRSTNSGSGGRASNGLGGSGSAGKNGGLTGGSGMTGGSAGGGTGAGGSMMFSVLTHPVGGRFQPRNIGAIWIEDSGGKFVKTLAVWAATRARYLTKFNAEAGANRVDAVTSATLFNHTTHNVTWNLKDVNGTAVPNGAYKVLVEVTDQDATGQFTEVDFAVPVQPVMPADTPYFTAMKVQ
jgi:hypothetical protein